MNLRPRKASATTNNASGSSRETAKRVTKKATVPQKSRSANTRDASRRKLRIAPSRRGLRSQKNQFRLMDLPMELRLMILKEMAASHGGSLLKLSTVCVQWREFFEKIIFTNVKLKSSSDIRWFDRMMTGRRKSLLQSIWLHVELWTYNCVICQTAETAAEAAANSKVFSMRLLQLLDILSTWDIKQNLTLELSAASPSDTSHCFGPLIGGQFSWADPRFHKAYFTQERRYVGSQRRTLGNLLDFDVGNRATIPEIREMKKFVISRRFQRSLSSGALMNVFRCLPYLEEIVYEPSRGVDFADDIARISAIKTLFRMLPRTVQKLQLWEKKNFNKYTFFGKRDTESLALVAAQNARSLVAFDASNLFKAHEFFRIASSYGPWSRMKSLTLRSTSREQPETLFCDAAATAMHMPNLQIMEIWAGSLGWGYLFRYEVLSGIAEISFEAQFRFDFSPKTCRAWRSVAEQRGLKFEERTLILDKMELCTQESVRSRLRSCKLLL